MGCPGLGAWCCFARFLAWNSRIDMTRPCPSITTMSPWSTGHSPSFRTTPLPSSCLIGLSIRGGHPSSEENFGGAVLLDSAIVYDTPNQDSTALHYFFQWRTPPPPPPRARSRMGGNVVIKVANAVVP